MIGGLPYWLAVPVLIAGVIVGWIEIIWLLRQFDVLGYDEPTDPAAGLKRARDK